MNVVLKKPHFLKDFSTSVNVLLCKEICFLRMLYSIQFDLFDATSSSPASVVNRKRYAFRVVFEFSNFFDFCFVDDPR